MSQKHLQSIHVSHYKHTAGCATEIMPTPDVVKISMSQHIGAPCKPLVAKGDYVKVGQKIGDTDAFVSAPIHSGVSGTVTAIEEQRNAAGGFETLVVIETDKKQELSEEVKVPAEPKDLAEFVKAVRESGLVGLGGASFPTHIKFNPKNIDDVHALIVNAAECEPFITSDHRLMLETPDALLDGCLLIMKYVGLDKGYIAIEENKPDAINASKSAESQTSKHSSFRQDTRRVLNVYWYTKSQARRWMQVFFLQTWASFLTTLQQLHSLVSTSRQAVRLQPRE